MNWSKGFEASYYITTVDAVTWRDVEKKRIKSGSVSITNSDLRETAELTTVDYNPTVEQWIRIWLDARQGENIEHVPLFTGLALNPKTNYEGKYAEYPLECYSVLQPAKDIWLQRGWYAPVGVKGGTIIKQLLSVTPAPIIIEGETPELKNSIIAEDGETRLSMVEKILLAINWRIRISGNGEIHVMDLPTEPVAKIGGDNDIIEKSLEIESDFYECPNVFMAVDDDVSGIARDDSEKSIYSTKTRGREIWNGEINCDLKENETVAEYALRRLKELQSTSIRMNYKRRFLPNVRTGDMIYIHYPAQNIDGEFIVKNQSFSLQYGAEVNEEVNEHK